MKTLITFCWVMMSFSGRLVSQHISLSDKFGRTLDTAVVQLVDWEGQIANPAIRLTLIPSPTVTFPVTVTVTADHARLYFDSPSQTGVNGPTKTLTLFANSPEEFYLSLFPDRDGADETHQLTLISQPTAGSPDTLILPIVVKDQDQPLRTADFLITTDFSEDTKNFFLSDTSRQNIVIQAAADWAYFIADMNLDPVGVGDEQTFIWNDEFAGGNWVSNAFGYTGFLLYAHGQDNNELRSGGGASNLVFQTSGGTPLPLRRSGAYHAEPGGNFNMLGWNTTMTEDTWYASQNLSNEPNDLYSIAMHEIGHTLGFHAFAYPNFNTFAMQGFIDDPGVVNYQGVSVPINASDHLNPGGSAFIVDRISQKGAFGSEYAPDMPLGRWLITKLSLLALKSIGYELRETTPFEELEITQNMLADGVLSQPYQGRFEAKGGVPIFDWQITVGNLPLGISLNRFTGEVSGVPDSAGVFSFTVEVEDYDGATRSVETSITIMETVGVEKDVVLGNHFFRVYPNPAQDEVTVIYDAPHDQPVLFRIVDNTGRQVQELRLTPGENVYSLNGLANGLYYFQVISKEETGVVKLVKMRK